MVVLDISLPTGFSPENSDLEMVIGRRCNTVITHKPSACPLLTSWLFVQLSNSVDHYISNFKVVDNLSDRGSLIIHLFKVKETPDCCSSRVGQTTTGFVPYHPKSTTTELLDPYFSVVILSSSPWEPSSLNHLVRAVPSVLPTGLPQRAGDPGLQAPAELQSGPPAAVLGQRLRVLQPR